MCCSSMLKLPLRLSHKWCTDTGSDSSDNIISTMVVSRFVQGEEQLLEHKRHRTCVSLWLYLLHGDKIVPLLANHTRKCCRVVLKAWISCVQVVPIPFSLSDLLTRPITFVSSKSPCSTFRLSSCFRFWHRRVHTGRIHAPRAS